MKSAVFLSYASQDSEAARRICAARQARGIEVWFDQNDLRGGDVWDQRIRQQIRDCALFIPLVSANTLARDAKSALNRYPPSAAGVPRS